MKDRFMLLLAAAIAAGMAWAFFHFLGSDAWPLLITTIALALSIDNRNLRKKVKDLEDRP